MFNNRKIQHLRKPLKIYAYIPVFNLSLLSLNEVIANIKYLKNERL